MWESISSLSLRILKGNKGRIKHYEKEQDSEVLFIFLFEFKTSGLGKIPLRERINKPQTRKIYL